MTNTRTILLAVVALAFVALSAPTHAELLLEARYWPAELSGRLQLENLETNEFFMGVDPINDLGLEEDGSYEGRLLYRSGGGALVRLAWGPISFTGDATLTGMVGPVTVTPRIVSTLDLDYGRLAFGWQFKAGRSVRIGPILEAKGFQGDAAISVDNPVVPIVRTTEFETGFPSAGILLDASPSDRVTVFAEYTTLIDTDEGDLTDAEAGVRFFVTKVLAISLGYRKIEIDVEDGLDRLEVDIDSAFAGVVARF